jgi:phytanoyl-CoA hydroxylase
LLALAHELARQAEAPVEYEAETGYPGAPESLQAPGGRTLRRLLGAFDRHPALADWARNPAVTDMIAAALGRPLMLSRAHHNCVMFKHPRYGSETGWHQDMRYWRFQRPELISSWLALTDVDTSSGCLYFMPGSHRLELAAERFDEAQFLRADFAPNAELLQRAVAVPMRAGDVVLFHSRLLHAARRSLATETRTSLIFTYRHADNRPLPGSRSARQNDVPVA